MAARRRPRIDLWVGIVLGLVLGVAVVAVFVFVFSEETVDAPRLEQNQTPNERPADR
jgi:Mg/Co/Ni transporter MgtE